MKRIIVIGCPGAGKSTFARKLRDLTGLPVYYLDMIWHRADRTNISREEFDDKLNAIISGDEWIIDGNYGRTLEARMEKCDAVFFLDYPVNLCIEGVEGRIGKVREDMPWVEMEFDEEFKKWILDFPARELPGIYDLIEKYRQDREIHIFKSRKDAADWLNKANDEMG